MREGSVTKSRRDNGTDYGYVNARLRGMKARLLDQSFYETLMASTDVPHAIHQLMETGYETALEPMLIHGRTAAVVDEALKDDMVVMYRKVLSFLTPDARELVATLLGRWDIFNIKTVLRGAHNHLSTDEIKQSLIPAGQLGGVELEALARIDDVKAVIDTLSTWGLLYARPLRAEYQEYRNRSSLAVLELALDRYYSDWASDRLKAIGPEAASAFRVLATQVDTLNLVTVFRLLKADIDRSEAEHYFLDGGKAINRDMYAELVAMSDVDDVLDRLKGGPYGSALDDAALRYLERSSIAVFERALEDHLSRRAKLAGVSDSLGVGVAIAYLWAKQNEVTNLRIIVKGIDVGMPADRMREELILV